MTNTDIDVRQLVKMKNSYCSYYYSVAVIVLVEIGAAAGIAVAE